MWWNLAQLCLLFCRWATLSVMQHPDRKNLSIVLGHIIPLQKLRNKAIVEICSRRHFLQEQKWKETHTLFNKCILLCGQSRASRVFESEAWKWYCYAMSFIRDEMRSASRHICSIRKTLVESCNHLSKQFMSWKCHRISNATFRGDVNFFDWSCASKTSIYVSLK